MRQLNQAELFALNTSQAQINEAKSRLDYMTSQHDALLRACGLDPAKNYSVMPDGTVLDAPEPKSIELPEEAVPEPKPAQIGRPK